MRISFEVSTDADKDGGVQVEVYLDREGRDYLVESLRDMNEKSEHFHMFSEAWGSDELTEERQSATSHVARHVKVYLRPDGEALFSPARKKD